MINDLPRYESLAIAARRVFEEHAANDPNWAAGGGFPRGYCGDCAELLAKYLRALGFPAVEVSGSMGSSSDYQTHAWVELDDLIIDVTADQFDGIDHAVMVTRDRTWHERWLANGRGAVTPARSDDDPNFAHAVWSALCEALDPMFQRAATS